jgi:hypothetical protein
MMEPLDPRDRFTLEEERAFGPSIQPIYRNSARKPQPEQIASCLLLNVDGVPIVCTAAHVADHLRYRVSSPLVVARRIELPACTLGSLCARGELVVQSSLYSLDLASSSWSIHPFMIW